MKYKFGLLKYSTNNLGDEIQSIAARQFLPKVDMYLDRDSLNKIKSKEPIKVILNGWFLQKPENWPPSPVIKPLFISFHITQNAIEKLTSPMSIEYFKKHEPIGCRDYYTLKILKDKGVNAYFSGCLTLTLKKPQVEKHINKILIVDIEEEVLKFLPREIKERAKFLSHYLSYPIDEKAVRIFKKFSNRLYFLLKRMKINSLLRKPVDFFYSMKNFSAKFKMAEEILKEYASSSLVITSRLHCALPCVAFGTPVIFVPKNPYDPRLKGYSEYLKIYSIDEFKKIDWINSDFNLSPQQKKKIEDLKTQLIQRCLQFIEQDEA
jgi:hypothetical protein